MKTLTHHLIVICCVVLLVGTIHNRNSLVDAQQPQVGCNSYTTETSCLNSTDGCVWNAPAHTGWAKPSNCSSYTNRTECRSRTMCHWNTETDTCGNGLPSCDEYS